MKHRVSYQLAQLRRELHKRAMKEKDEEKRRDYWRLYYKAQDAEAEVNGLVADAEIRTLLDYALLYGRLPDDWREQIAKFIQDKANADEPQPPPVDEVDDDDIPPRQLGFWDKEE